MSLGPGVRAAIRDAAITDVDERGLVPLERARAHLDGVTGLAAGGGSMVEGRWVLPADITWAALLSLADVAEFVGRAGRLDWGFRVRGNDNLAVWERYGEAMLPWIAGRVDADGRLDDTPMCLLSCLLACGAEAAFELAGRVRRVEPDTYPDLEVDETAVLCAWVARHPRPGYRLLVRRIGDGDAVARMALRASHGHDPRGTAHWLVEAAGPEAARRLLDGEGLSAPALPVEVRAVLDRTPRVELPGSHPVPVLRLNELYASYDCPMWENANIFCAAMRMTGFVVPGGTDGLVVQSLVTDRGERAARLEFHCVGLDVPAGTRWDAACELVGAAAIDDWLAARQPLAVDLPGGRVELDVPGTAPYYRELGPVAAAMTRVAELPPERFFQPARQLVERLDLPANAVELFAIDHWRGPEFEQPPGETPDLVLAVEALRERRGVTASVTGTDWRTQIRARMDLYGTEQW